MVGEPENTAVWYVLQHSPLEVIEEYMPVIKEASEKGELPKHLVGMMEDRVLMYKDEPQIYGTQGKQITLNSGEAKWIIWPITNPQEVNERRKEVGFKTTVEENAQRMGIQYEVISLEELKTMSKY